MDKNIVTNKYKGILVIDRCGSGKTTLIKEILKENENYIYLGDMFQVSEIRLRQVIDGGRFIFMEHTRLSEQEYNLFEEEGFFIGSIEEVKKLMVMGEYKAIEEQKEIIKQFSGCNVNAVKRRI
ncbi:MULTISPECIES: hypothetical protein [Enterobacter]|uniref:hypothetical protein n=1 Tax=Enterobacter TaxID=547 RepID=UPI000CC63F34|nr:MULTISPECIES: hypothetical protein [Enterobacter]PJD02532.1 hypothetical protein B9Q19_21875 [Enterobacter bugandensis]PJD44162.1 hypothetical protein B9Q24_01820 [Enterobacter kobei]PJD48414.1 hypothetical protein B9Q33_05510 [Enterobacter kobei]PJD53281.1 hypothetical protein B9Q23_06145 [Enterobacter kobei]PJD58969.1 hypothetical protein B9Q27_02735 [Enterobacter kobei]